MIKQVVKWSMISMLVASFLACGEEEKKAGTTTQTKEEATTAIKARIESFEKNINGKDKKKIIDDVSKDATDYQYIKKEEFFESSDSTSSGLFNTYSFDYKDYEVTVGSDIKTATAKGKMDVSTRDPEEVFMEAQAFEMTFVYEDSKWKIKTIKQVKEENGSLTNVLKLLLRELDEE